MPNKPVRVVPQVAPEMPADVNELCARVREVPHLLNHWGKSCPPQALLAAVLREPVMWGAVPPAHQGLVQAAAQMLNVVGLDGPGEAVLEQPAVKAWLDEHGAEGRARQLELLRNVAAAEAEFVVRRKLSACQHLLQEFAADDVSETSTELAAQVRSAQVAVDRSKPAVGASSSDEEVHAWLQARMTSAYLAGDENLSAALRGALQALKSAKA